MAPATCGNSDLLDELIAIAQKLGTYRMQL